MGWASRVYSWRVCWEKKGRENRSVKAKTKQLIDFAYHVNHTYIQH